MNCLKCNSNLFISYIAITTMLFVYIMLDYYFVINIPVYIDLCIYVYTMYITSTMVRVNEGIKQRYPSRTENQLEVGTIVRLWQSRGTSEKYTSTRRQQIIGNYRCTNQSMCSSTLTRQHLEVCCHL